MYNKFSDNVNEIYNRYCPRRTYKFKILEKQTYFTNEI